MHASEGGLTEAAVAETHLSVVVFVGDRAFTLKKPLTTGFVDFSTRELRHAACLRETELNRRPAPDAYLGVADLIGPDGQLCDHLLVMRRLPADRRLSTLVTGGADLDRPLHDVVDKLVVFHAAAARGTSIDEAATAEAVRRNWQAKAEQMIPFAGRAIERASSDRVLDLAARYLDGRMPSNDNGASIDSRDDGDGGEVEPLHAVGDSAYADGHTQDLMSKAGHRLTAKVPPTRNSTGGFAKDKFDIDLETGTVGCPAGQTATIKPTADGGGRAAFGAVCADCPLRAQCTKAKAGRVVMIHPHEQVLQTARAAQQHPDWQAFYRQTPADSGPPRPLHGERDHPRTPVDQRRPSTTAALILISLGVSA